MPNIATLGVDRTVLLFTIALAIVTTVAHRIAAGMARGAPRVAGRPQGGSRGGRHPRDAPAPQCAGGRRSRARHRARHRRRRFWCSSHAALTRIDPGFSPAGVLTLAMSLPPERYPDAPTRRRFFEALLERLDATAGVRSAALVNVLPFSTYERRTRFVIEGGRTCRLRPGADASSRIASAGYFDTMGIPIVAGRAFGRSRPRLDRACRPCQPARSSKRYLADGDPLGRRIRLGAADGPRRGSR